MDDRGSCRPAADRARRGVHGRRQPSQVCVATGGAAGSGPQHVTCQTGHPQFTLGPDGTPVIDQFSFVHQPLTPDGSITARVSSLTGQYATGVVPAGEPVGGRSQRLPAMGEGRRDRQEEPDTGISLCSGHGHRQPRRAHAVRLHPRPRRHPRHRLCVSSALAQTDTLRRHAYRLRLDRRPPLDGNRLSPPHRPAYHGAGRDVRRRFGRLHIRRRQLRRAGGRAWRPASSITSTSRVRGRAVPGTAIR